MGFDATLFILLQEFILALERSYQPETRLNIPPPKKISTLWIA